jgi:hypothetical protein
MTGLDQAAASGAIELQSFERGRHSLLAAPLPVAPGIQVVLELFDKHTPLAPLRRGVGGEGGFTPDDQRLVAAAADFGTEMLRQALAERQTQRVLFDAVAAALGAGDSIRATLGGTPDERREEPPPPAVMDRLRQGLSEAPEAAVDAEQTLRLVEAVRVLALRHGTPAVRHCTRLIEELQKLLDTITGSP